jgi:hypothetical protein
MIGMRMGADKIVELLNVVALQRVENDFTLAGITSVNQDCLASRRDNENRIAITRPNIKYMNLKFAT